MLSKNKLFIAYSFSDLFSYNFLGSVDIEDCSFVQSVRDESKDVVETEHMNNDDYNASFIPLKEKKNRKKVAWHWQLHNMNCSCITKCG